MVNSINTNIAAYFAQQNIGVAANNAASSIARLSSGNRIVRAADDVAALAIGTSFKTQISTLRTALTNAAQGTSLLQIADGAAAKVTEILQRQKAIALQAGSGSLSNSDRVFLNQEFQALTEEIDRLSGGVTFNGVKLLDGSLSQSASLADNDSLATAASLNLTFNNDIITSETVKFIVGTTTVTLTAGTDFTVGASLAETVNNLAVAANTLAEATTNNTTLGRALFSSSGSTLVIEARAGGSLGNSFVVDMSGTATNSGEATLAGGYGNVSSFNLFSVTTGLTSTSTVVSATSASASAPFQVGDSITATVSGVSKTLFTLTSGTGSGASGAFTLQDIVNGINGNAGTTGFSAALVYSSGTYNIRLSYAGTGSNILINAGTNYNGATYNLNGQGLDTTASNTEVAAGATKRQALFFTKFIDVLTTPGLGAAITTTVTAAVGSVTTAVPFAVGDTLTMTINGETKVLRTFQSGDGLDDIVSGINGGTALHGVRAAISGSTGAYNLRLYFTDPGATYGTISAGANIKTGVFQSAPTTAITTGATITQTVNASLGGGADNGLGQGSVTATGTVGDGIITALGTSKPVVSVLLTANPTAADTITVGGKVFTFTSNTTRSPDEILIGSSLQDTLDNAVGTLNAYLADGYALGGEAFVLNQLNITRSGSSLVFEGKGVQNVTTIAGAAAQITQSITGASITNSGNLNNASSTYGVNVTGVNNADFQGSIGGFTATYTGTVDTVDLAVTIGDYTYTAQDVDATVTSNTTIRFYSNTLGDGSSGGYFDVQLKANQVSSFSNQAGADVVANRLNAAFSSLTFVQKRAVSSYNGTDTIVSGSTVVGSLIGTKVSAQIGSFDNLRLNDISVVAPSGSNTDARITFTINGVNYSTASGLGDTLGANQTYRLLSEVDPNQFIEFTTGDSAIDISAAAYAVVIEDALRTAFGADEGSAALSFQVGASSADQLAVSIGNAKTDTLYGGLELDVLTQASAAIASTTLDAALAEVTSIRANIGALQSRFGFASSSIEISIQNQVAALSTINDTDVAKESTDYATFQVQYQAGISVLAQANQQLQSLLKLIG